MLQCSTHSMSFQTPWSPRSTCRRHRHRHRCAGPDGRRRRHRAAATNTRRWRSGAESRYRSRSCPSDRTAVEPTRVVSPPGVGQEASSSQAVNYDSAEKLQGVSQHLIYRMDLLRRHARSHLVRSLDREDASLADCCAGPAYCLGGQWLRLVPTTTRPAARARLDTRTRRNDPGAARHSTRRDATCDLGS